MLGTHKFYGKKSKAFLIIALTTTILISLEMINFLYFNHYAHFDFLAFTTALGIIWIIGSYLAGKNSYFSLLVVPFIILGILEGPINPTPESLDFAKTMIIILFIFADIVTWIFFIEHRSSRKIVRKNKVTYEDEIKEVLKEFEYLEPP